MATTNVHKQELIGELRKSKELASVVRKLSRPHRQAVEVNLSKIDSEAKAGDMIVVPGKVLGVGSLTKKITIAAWKATNPAFEKIKSSGSTLVPLSSLTGKKLDRVKVIG